MSLFPRFTQDFAPIFRLFNEYDRLVFSGIDHHFNSVRSFTPKFDVKETKEGYELHGELPGIMRKDINIEWTDNNTLVIAGRHEHVRQSQPHQAVESGENSQQKKLEHQTTVENEAVETNPNAEPTSQVAEQSREDNVVRREEAPKAKYWVSERAVGEFHRSFAFPARVDQDAVQASLKDGILFILVPKQTAPESKKINIE